MQPYPYTLWVSGTSLLLLSTELSAQEQVDALDIQLFAWLKAEQEHTAGSENERWQQEYMSSQQGLGLVVSNRRQSLDPAPKTGPIKPLHAVKNALLEQLPGTHHAGIETCLAALLALPATHPALQALRAEAVDDAASWLSFELQVVLPGLQLFASSLYLKSRDSIPQHWLDQPLTPTHLRLAQCTGQVHEATFASVRNDLRGMLKDTRNWYLLNIKI